MEDWIYFSIIKLLCIRLFFRTLQGEKKVCLMSETFLILQKTEWQRGRNNRKINLNKTPKMNMLFSLHWDSPRGESKTRSLEFWMYWQVVVRLHIHLLHHTWILQCTLYLASNVFKIQGPLKLLYWNYLPERLKCFTAPKNMQWQRSNLRKSCCKYQKYLQREDLKDEIC